jgi:hypothetical protein
MEPDMDLTVRRYMNYSDSDVLGKEQEEACCGTTSARMPPSSWPAAWPICSVRCNLASPARKA